METVHSRAVRFKPGYRKLKWVVIMLGGFLAGFLASGLIA